MPQNAPHVAVTVNIAFRRRSGDLILMNVRLAKPIRHVLVYFRAPRMGLCAFLQRTMNVRMSVQTDSGEATLAIAIRLPVSD
jgi:hypothetical protein